MNQNIEAGCEAQPKGYFQKLYRKLYSKQNCWSCSKCDLTFDQFKNWADHQQLSHWTTKEPIKTVTLIQPRRLNLLITPPISNSETQNLKDHLQVTSPTKATNEYSNLTLDHSTAALSRQVNLKAIDYHSNSDENLYADEDEPQFIKVSNNHNDDPDSDLTKYLTRVCQFGRNFYKCSICSMLFLGRTQARDHIGKHTGVSSYCCLLCPRKFRYKHGLKGHVSLCHTGDRPYPCRFCSRSFATSQQRSSHRVRSHPIISKCTALVKGRLSQPSKLVKMDSSHSVPVSIRMSAPTKQSIRVKKTAEINSKTQFSSAKQTSRQERTRFQNSHLKPKTYKRPKEVDIKVVKSSSTAQRHLTWTTKNGVRVVACKFCPRTYPAKFVHVAVAHIRSHTKEQPFECSFCGRKFSQPSNCKRHIKIHFGDTPFQCSNCTRAFSDEISLNLHKERKHGTGGENENRKIEYLNAAKKRVGHRKI